MFIKTTLAAAASIALGLASSASAQSGRDVTFSFAANAPAQTVYAQITETAAHACRYEFSRSAVDAAYPGIVRNCTEDLVQRVVDQIGREDVADLHRNSGAALKLMAAR